jgi:NAD dependent epimerase/dehydratase
MKSILITGSEGFIGSHAVDFFLEKNFFVRAFVHYNSNNRIGWLKNIKSKNKKNLEIHFGDIRDEKNTEKSFKNINYVIHLAALIGIPYSYYSPRSYIETNIIGTYNVLESSLRNKITRLLTTSTSEVYGSALYTPIKEDHPLQGQSPYSASKIGADKLAESYYKSFNLPLTIARPFNTYGPRQSTRAIIPTIITQLLLSNKLKMGTTFTKRDFNYVADTIDAFYKILNCKKLIGKEVNICTQKNISIDKLINEISIILNKKNKIIYESKRRRPEKSEVNNLIGSCKLLKKYTRWKSNVSLREGLYKTISWYKDPNNLKYFKEIDYSI